MGKVVTVDLSRLDKAGGSNQAAVRKLQDDAKKLIGKLSVAAKYVNCLMQHLFKEIALAACCDFLIPPCPRLLFVVTCLYAIFADPCHPDRSRHTSAVALSCSKNNTWNQRHAHG